MWLCCFVKHLSPSKFQGDQRKSRANSHSSKHLRVSLHVWFRPGKKHPVVVFLFFFFCDPSINPETKEAAGAILPLSVCSEPPLEMRMMMEKDGEFQHLFLLFFVHVKVSQRSVPTLPWFQKRSDIPEHRLFQIHGLPHDDQPARSLHTAFRLNPHI